MKWLQDNPLGVVLAAIAGVFILLALGMVVVWNLPVSVDLSGAEVEQGAVETTLAAHQIDTLNKYDIINQKPVFNESRLPEIQEGEDETVEDTVVEVKDMPDIKLTGVIITPSMRIASLMPGDEKLESVMAHEGQAMTGEFVGWQVSKVNPRNVVLEARDGQKLQLELLVHDMAIKEPPKPVAPAKTALAEPVQEDQMVDEDGEPLSRAEQIRQRIAERREELRLEQENQQSSGQRRGQLPPPSGRGSKADNPPSYEEAIRTMINNNRKDNGSNDKKDG